MTTTHTPGPWKAGSTNNTWAKVYADGRCIAHVKPIHADGARQAGDFDQESANTALIAAAPDLAEALRLALDTIASLHGHYCPDCKGGCPDLETIAIGRAAIAKAEGLV